MSQCRHCGATISPKSTKSDYVDERTTRHYTYFDCPKCNYSEGITVYHHWHEKDETVEKCRECWQMVRGFKPQHKADFGESPHIPVSNDPIRDIRAEFRVRNPSKPRNGVEPRPRGNEHGNLLAERKSVETDNLAQAKEAGK